MSHWRSFLDARAGGRYLRWTEVARATGLSRTTAWRLQKLDEFPAPYAISPGRVGYREDEVEAWRISRDPSSGPHKPVPGVKRAVSKGRLPTLPQADRENAGLGAPPPAQVAAPPALMARVAPSTLPGPARKPAAQHRKPGRRRSQHALAIAQQMLLDF